jgi:hypothetical protein
MVFMSLIFGLLIGGRVKHHHFQRIMSVPPTIAGWYHASTARPTDENTIHLKHAFTTTQPVYYFRATHQLETREMICKTFALM